MTSTVSVLLGNGDGTFRPRRDFATGSEPFSVTSADFNFDGKPDLAIANFSSNTVSIFVGNGDGTFGRFDYPAGTHPVSVAADDFNLDAKADLVVVDNNASAVSVLLNTTP
jgi:hypothetical protein